jgi:hypothetical protein
MNVDERLRKVAVPYGLYFGLLQLPATLFFYRWFTMPVASGLALMLLTLIAYPIFMRGLPIYFLKWKTDGYWTFLTWLPWSVVMGLTGFLIGYILPDFRQ